MSTVNTVKINVRRRLSLLGVSAYTVSIGSGHAPDWLSGIIGGERYTVKIATSLVEQMAIALGVPIWRLLEEGADLSVYPPPAWLLEKSTGG